MPADNPAVKLPQNSIRAIERLLERGYDVKVHADRKTIKVVALRSKLESVEVIES